MKEIHGSFRIVHGKIRNSKQNNKNNRNNRRNSMTINSNQMRNIEHKLAFGVGAAIIAIVQTQPTNQWTTVATIIGGALITWSGISSHILNTTPVLPTTTTPTTVTTTTPTTVSTTTVSTTTPTPTTTASLLAETTK